MRRPVNGSRSGLTSPECYRQVALPESPRLRVTWRRAVQGQVWLPTANFDHVSRVAFEELPGSLGMVEMRAPDRWLQGNAWSVRSMRNAR